MIRRIMGVLVLLLAVPAVSRACACSAAPPGKCPGLQKDDVVFLGRVTDLGVVKPSEAEAAGNGSGAKAGGANANATMTIRYHFHIDEKFAGPDTQEIDVYSGGDDGDCGYRFKKGVRYLVFTEQGTEGRLFATICNGTRPAVDAVALVPQLRAMRDGKRVASVFGILRLANPPTLAPPNDPDEPLPSTPLQLRSRYDRFTATTDANGMYTFYDVHGGEYQFTADLVPNLILTQRTLTGLLPVFELPDGACYEYDIDALPTGHIQGSVLDPEGKPLRLASLELYRADNFDISRSGLWTFQGFRGVFDFDHIGPGEYILVYNRPNRKNPNSPYPRTFYPGTEDPKEAKPIEVKEGQQLFKVDFVVIDPFPTRTLRVHLNWKDGMPPGSVTVMAKGDQGENPAAQKVGDGVFDFTLLESAHYALTAWEDIEPAKPGKAHQRNENCEMPPRIESDSLFVDGADEGTKEITLTFGAIPCGPAQ
jgi:hypothetical protein